jgi:hypothetical protein
VGGAWVSGTDVEVGTVVAVDGADVELGGTVVAVGGTVVAVLGAVVEVGGTKVDVGFAGIVIVLGVVARIAGSSLPPPDGTNKTITITSAMTTPPTEPNMSQLLERIA